MSDIRVLSPYLVNKIAAGEVVERPASVVKELVENALDAAVRRIDVAVEKGGRSLITVSDDGAGMSAENLARAFLPHATSKLADEEDLFRIATMGFRGEALASIAAVSHAKIRTRRREDESGYEVQASGETIGQVRPCATTPGTIISVADLFFSTPARRKFLKSDSTELGHISEAMARVALPYKEVAFTLTHNGRKVLELPAVETIQRRVVDLFGQELAQDLIELRADESAAIRVSGVIGAPAAARATTRWQYFFLNGRYIRDRYLLHALKEAYRGLIDPHRQPVALIFIELPLEEVDVNVHPTKVEVRFRDSQSVHSHVLAGLRETLQKAELRPHAQLAGASLTAGFGEPEAGAGAAANLLPAEKADDPRRQSLREALADFFKSQAPQGKLQFPEVRDRPPQTAAPQRPAAALAPSTPSRYWPQGPELAGRADGAAAQAGTATVARPQVEFAKPLADSPARPFEPARPQSAAAIAPAAAEPTAAAEPKVLQVHGTYLIVAESDGITIIDQHALHERILYNQLLKRLSAGPLESQHLLVPAVLPVTPVQRARLLDHTALLGRLGIETSDFGPGRAAIHRFPSFLDKLDPAGFLADVLDQLAEDDPSLDAERLLHQLIDMMACKAAIKAGDELREQEVQSLLAQREGEEKATACPHGRPTQIRLTLRDLEKQFKRG